MIPRLDALGWGLGPQDLRPPLPLDGPAARRGRELLVHLLVEALQTWEVGKLLITRFALPPRDDDAYASFVRLLTLIDRLFQSELPRLKRAIRCENHPEMAWMPEPRGGRLDPLRSLRQPGAAPAPQQWLVVRGRRIADTPPNRVAAAILRHAVDRLAAARCALVAAGMNVHSDLDFAGLGLRRLRRFLAHSPLGAVPPIGLSSGLVREAQRRRQSWRRLRTLWGWWLELKQVNLEAIQVADSDREQSLSLYDTYEAAAALSLVLALGDRLGAPVVSEGGLRYGRGSMEVLLTLGGSLVRDLPGRDHTAMLRVRDGAGQRVVVLEARNARGDAAAALFRPLVLLARSQPGVTGWLITPEQTELGGVASARAWVWPLNPQSTRATASLAWAPALDDLFNIQP